MKNRVTITLHWGAMYSDIVSKARLAGESVENKGASIKRAMTSALAHVRAACVHEHAIWEHKHTADDRQMAEDNVIVTLHLPELYDLSANAALAQYMHDYIAAKALRELMAGAKPEGKASGTVAQGTIAAAQNAINNATAAAIQDMQVAMQGIVAMLRSRVRRMKKGTVVTVGIGDKQPTPPPTPTIDKIYYGMTESESITSEVAYGFVGSTSSSISVNVASAGYIWFCSKNVISKIECDSFPVPFGAYGTILRDGTPYHAYRVENKVVVDGVYTFNITKQ